MNPDVLRAIWEPSRPMLEVEDLHVRYRRLRAVRGVSLTVGEGEIVCLVGPNGAGKSSTLRSIAGLHPPAQGDIRLAGRSVTGLAPETIARLGLSMVPEGRHVFTQLTVEENILLGSQMRRDRKQVRADFERMLGELPLPARAPLHPRRQALRRRAAAAGDRPCADDEPPPHPSGRAFPRPRAHGGGHGLRDPQGAARTRASRCSWWSRAPTVRLENGDRIYIIRSGLIELEGDCSELTDERVEQAYFGFGEADADADRRTRF